MTTRADVKTDYNSTPRIVEVEAPSAEFAVQDVVDTLRKTEDSFRGMSETRLLNASGKENLGDGVSVGITVELQDAQIAFEGRTTPAQIGIVTTASAAPVANRIELIDTSATFQSNNVARGSLIVNFNDMSIAEVYDVQSENILTCKVPVNGSLNIFALNDDYHIFNIIQCKVGGGNLVAVDDAGDELSSILPTAFTQIVRTSSASATLQDLEAVQYSSFQNGVWLDVTKTAAGTNFPAGTREFPVNNAQDATFIAASRGFDVIFVVGNYTFTTGDIISEYEVRGQSPTKTIVTIEAGADTVNTEFFDLHIQGTLDGGSTVRECLVDNLNYVNGYIYECALATGVIVLGGAEDAYIVNCFTAVPGGAVPAIDMSGTGQGLAIRGHNGGLSIRNKTGTDAVSIDMNSGEVIIDSTVTDGEIIVRGVGRISDNSTGNTLVDSTGLLSGTETVITQGFVCIDETNGGTGTGSPMGTRSFPVNNFTDAIQIANNNNVVIFEFVGYATVGAADNVSGFLFRGDGASSTVITLTPGCTTLNSQFTNVSLTGTVNGSIILRDSVLINLAGLEGLVHQCAFQGGSTSTLGGDATILSCYSLGVAGAFPILDYNGAQGNVLILRDWNGPFTLQNLTVDVETCIDLNSGIIILDSTITAGNFPIRGVGKVVDNSTGTATVSDTVINKTNVVIDTQAIVDGVWGESLANHNDPATFGESLGFLGFIDRCVFLDTDSGTNGDGTMSAPFNVLNDALDFAETQNIKQIVIFADIILDRNLKNFKILGVGVPEFDCNGFDLKNSEFHRVTFKGLFTESVIVQESVLVTGSYMNGFFENCALMGDVTATPNAQVFMKSCASAIPGSGSPSISLNPGSTSKISVRGFQGGLTVKDCNTVTDEITVSLNPGSLTFDASNTDGLMIARGLGVFVDNSAGATVIDETANAETTADAVWDSAKSDHTVIGSFGEQLGKKLLTISKFLGLK